MFESLAVGPSGHVSCPMDPRYAAFKGAFGGWTAAHALLAAQSLAPSTFEPASMSIDFMRGILPGGVSSGARLIHQTRSAMFMSVSTEQEAAPVASSSVVLTARRATRRIDAAVRPRCADAETLERLQIETGPNTWIEQFDMRVAEGRLLQTNPGLRSLVWTRLLDTCPGVHAQLAALADASFPRIYFHFDRVTPIATITMSVHFHADTAELEEGLADPVLVEAYGHGAGHGLFDQQVRIWSRAGRLLGTSAQLAQYDVSPT